ncbi:MATE efflux family protein [Thermoclostridium stercorarium subsp. stercorarium DSM 8532]|uniref:MATE efflux family protein n=3 Tax=Thermoclostridium stercorarium TaxID=1510 RepID=L7VP91_THES1|nr:MATE efflux family protein [Thermoclostridium stercorarium subsp. stercorarium DSM 8532]AGI39512.1 efflux protein [Thermoclostridium stercorarium subsp. stercorarium DSM 8532]ANW98854.1 MATE family efflux transporter [Thermoclostridium stercorarium subsp. thermolacticum DSM 2910]ANX01379.1 MATE family efflux transporter [Thermoclostridium stercorarium subsp. leptospartum DSM 9219]
MRRKNYEIDMCNGPLLGKIIIFSIPMILSGILQLLYNAADVIVVGRFTGSTALAAVGSTGSLTNLIVNLFMGLSVGTSVTVAQYYGAGDWKNVSRAVHTSIATSIISGILVGVFGFCTAKRLLMAMDTPADVLDQAALYMRIYFVGIPASMVYNFGSSILRAVGDTRRPFIFLSVSGLINVVLNLFFVIVFHMGVAGVAWATVISQVISAVLIIISLIQFNGPCRLFLKDIKVYRDMLWEMVKIGIPAGLQGTIFSISNVLIQSSVNSFGSDVMAGNSAASNIEGFIYAAMNSIYNTALTFTGQNVGAKKYNRINRILGICLLTVFTIGFGMGMVALLFGRQLLGIYVPHDDEVIKYGLIRLNIITKTYFLCGMMDVMVGMIRGMGKSFMPMLVSIIGVCGIRISWIFLVFAKNRDLAMLYISYPVSWLVTFAIHFLTYFFIKKRVAEKENALEIQPV